MNLTDVISSCQCLRLVSVSNFVMTRFSSLPRLDVGKVSPKRRDAVVEALPDMQPRAPVFHHGASSVAIKEQLPTIPEASHAPHGSLKALTFNGLATVPLPTVVYPSQQKRSEAHMGWSEAQFAARSRPDRLPPQLCSEPGRHPNSTQAPHYAIPQDRTPLWSERERPGRLGTPGNPYKQNLDIAPKLKKGANSLITSALFGRAAELVSLESSRSPRQAATHRLETGHLEPLRPADLTHAGSLKQASSTQ